MKIRGAFGSMYQMDVPCQNGLIELGRFFGDADDGASNLVSLLPAVIQGVPRIIVTPAAVLRKTHILGSYERNDLSWSLRDLVARTLVNPCIPTYTAGSPLDITADLEQILAIEMARHSHAFASMSGKDFERFVAKTLSVFNVEVQGNVRIRGAEIDLLLCRRGEDSKNESFHILECKNWVRSNSPVRLREVLRAIGLRKLIRDKLVPVSNAILSTTSFTRPARAAAAARQVDLIQYDEFASWLAANDLLQRDWELPLAVTRRVNDAMIQLPPFLMAFINAQRVPALTVTPVGRHVELYNMVGMWSPYAHLWPLVIDFDE